MIPIFFDMSIGRHVAIILSSKRVGSRTMTFMYVRSLLSPYQLRAYHAEQRRFPDSPALCQKVDLLVRAPCEHRLSLVFQQTD